MTKKSMAKSVCSPGSTKAAEDQILSLTNRVDAIVLYSFNDVLEALPHSLCGRKFNLELGIEEKGPGNQVGEGQAWFVDVSAKKAKVVGNDCSRYICKPGDVLVVHGLPFNKLPSM